MAEYSLDTEQTLPHNNTYEFNRKVFVQENGSRYKGVIQIEARDTENKDIVVELSHESGSRSEVNSWLDQHHSLLEGKLDLISPKKRK